MARQPLVSHRLSRHLHLFFICILSPISLLHCSYLLIHMAGVETIIPIMGGAILIVLFIAAYIKTKKSERNRLMCCFGTVQTEQVSRQNRTVMTERTSTRCRDDSDNLSGRTLTPNASSELATPRNSHVVQIDRPRTPSYVYMVMM